VVLSLLHEGAAAPSALPPQRVALALAPMLELLQ
jgi:hypothetical protein